MSRAALAVVLTLLTVAAGCLGGSTPPTPPAASKSAQNATVVDDGSAAIAANASLGDGYYAKESAWRFDPVIQDQVQGQDVNCFFADCFSWSMDVHVTAYAFKADAGPDDLGR